MRTEGFCEIFAVEYLWPIFNGDWFKSMLSKSGVDLPLRLIALIELFSFNCNYCCVIYVNASVLNLLYVSAARFSFVCSKFHLQHEM